MNHCIRCHMLGRTSAAPFLWKGNSLCGVHLKEKYLEVFPVGDSPTEDEETPDEVEWVDLDG